MPTAGNGRPFRIGVASVMQETNTFSPLRCTMDDFVAHGLARGHAVADRYGDTATEVGGALRAVAAAGATPVPLVRAWASSSGIVTRATVDELCTILSGELAANPSDGLLLSLHGAMITEGGASGDLAVLRCARAAIGADIPIAICLDLHANVTQALVDAADVIVGYHTYPHIDLAETGARAVRMLVGALRGDIAPLTEVAKRPMLVPAETMSTTVGPLAELRKAADAATTGSVLDVSLFPVQPWLDVAELGFGVTVTTDGDRSRAAEVAELLASEAWARRDDFALRLYAPADAIEIARRSPVRPFLLSESADAPTAGAAGDSPAMVRALLDHAPDLVSYVTLADADGVARCHAAGAGREVDVVVGAATDRRFHEPVAVSGVVERVGDTPVRLTGPSYTGTDFSMGRWAVIRSGRVSVLITERPAFTLDPATFAHVGLDPARADVIVVRSATGFRAAFPPASAAAAITVDLPGASTPRLDLLSFRNAPRPMYPLDRDAEPVAAGAPNAR